MKYVTPMIRRNDKHCEMCEYWSKAILRVVPDAELVIHYCDPPPGRFRFDPCAGDWGKAHATSVYTKDGPILVMDVDSLLIEPFEWKPESPDTILAMNLDVKCVPFPGDDRPITWEICQNCGLLEPDERVFVNPQFFWASADVLPYFDRAEGVMRKFNRRAPFPDYMLGLTVWTLAWLQLKKEGRAERLPKPEGVWHCPNPPGDRLEILREFYEYIAAQPVDSTKPPGSEWIAKWT